MLTVRGLVQRGAVCCSQTVSMAGSAPCRKYVTSALTADEGLDGLAAQVGAAGRGELRLADRGAARAEGREGDEEESDRPLNLGLWALQDWPVGP